MTNFISFVPYEISPSTEEPCSKIRIVANFIYHAKIMAGKISTSVMLISCIMVFAPSAQPAPYYSLPSLMDQGKYGGSGNQMVVAAIDKPIDSVLDAIVELGGRILFLIPQRDFKKRDPDPGPDLGTGRGFSGQHTANVMWGQLASSSPTGPGKRKRNPADGRGAAIYSIHSGVRSIRQPEEIFPYIEGDRTLLNKIK